MLHEHFSAYGVVIVVHIPTDRSSGAPRGFGFVTFADSAAAKTVLDMDEHTIDGRQVKVRTATPRRDAIAAAAAPAVDLSAEAAHKGGAEPADKRKVFVGGVAHTVTDDEFRAYFEKFGTVVDALLMYDSVRARSAAVGAGAVREARRGAAAHARVRMARTAGSHRARSTPSGRAVLAS